MITRDQAMALLLEHIKSKYVIRHSIATEAVLRGLARRLGHDQELWGITGLLHDLDYEDVAGDPMRHGRVTVSILEGYGCPKEMLDAILAHNGDQLGIPCRAPLDFALTAGESVTGLVFAMALVLPSRSVSDVKSKSVQKRLREPRFAANVSRERVGQYAGLGLSEEEFITIAVQSMKAEPRCLELD